MKHRRSAFLIATVLVLASCSSSGSDASDDAADTGSGDDASETTAATGDDGDAGDAGEELPSFMSDFDRVCETQVGFPGATPVSETGPHPVVLFEETDSGILITSSADLPAGWAVEEDTDFEDNSELAAAELIACSVVGSTEANGTSCDLEGDDGETVTLDLVDVTYELTVYEATTGEEVGSETLEAASTDCPSFVFVDEGQTEYYNSPDETDYTNALKPYVDA